MATVARKRKRRPGGGRKTIGPSAKSANFNSRITPRLKEALQAEAKAMGLKVARAAEILLERSIASRREQSRTNPTQALLYVIGGLAEKCAVKLPNGKRFDWNTEPFVFEAFTHAISMLFNEVRPQANSTIKAEMSAPDVAHYYAQKPIITSIEHGQWAFWDIWDDILGVQPPSKEQEAAFADLSATDMNAWKQLGYDAFKVRRDLGIGDKQKDKDND